MHLRSVVIGMALIAAPACFAQTAHPVGAGSVPTPREPTMPMPMHDPKNPNRVIPSPSAGDQQLAASVQQILQRDSSLSPAGRQVKVIASDGAVVLRGPVANDAEKAKIDAVVRSVPGVKEVTNELDIRQ